MDRGISLPVVGGKVKREHRPLLHTLRDLPGDWLFERNKVPGVILTVVLAVSVPVGKFVGVDVGSIFAYNWMLSLAPTIALAGRMVYHRFRDGYWDVTWWTRPQQHQKKEVLEAPEAPAELMLDPQTLRTLAGKIVAWQQKNIAVADRTPRADGSRWERFADRARIFGARQLDDWLCQRARTPAFVISMTTLAIGHFVVAIPNTFLFPLNLIVTGIPTILAAYITFKTGDIYRLTRPGVRQRPRQVVRAHETLGLLSAPSIALTGKTAASPRGAQMNASRPMAAKRRAVLRRFKLAHTTHNPRPKPAAQRRGSTADSAPTTALEL